MKIILGLAFLALAACHPAPPALQYAPASSTGWSIGPIMDGRNYSDGGSIEGNTITLGEVHYVTRKPDGPLEGTISLSFHLDAPLKGAKCGVGTASLFFQAASDDWATDGARWWAATTTLDHAGDYTLTAPLVEGPWTSVLSMTSTADPEFFSTAKLNVGNVGFTLGNCEGLGHGAVGPAHLTITNWSVQPSVKP